MLNEKEAMLRSMSQPAKATHVCKAGQCDHKGQYLRRKIAIPPLKIKTPIESLKECLAPEPTPAPQSPTPWKLVSGMVEDANGKSVEWSKNIEFTITAVNHAAALQAENAELRGALENVKKHQEYIAPLIYKGTGAWAIANKALTRSTEVK